MLVVADSSPLHYLVLIDHVDVLPILFQDVIIPEQVAKELTHPSAPAAVRDFAARPPKWFRIEIPQTTELIPDIDEGESAAISLAQQLRADLLLIDDLDGREAAVSRGVAIIGTIGVLEAASAQGLLDLRSAFERIRATNFRVSDALIAEALKRDRDRQ